MNSFIVWITFSLLIINITSTDAFARDPSKPVGCELERVKKMVGYVCTNLNLDKIPKNLKSSTEVLDISHNHIKNLLRTSFEPYLDLKFLYLQENRIRDIEDETFSKLEDLEALDLSGNGLIHIPPEIFKLPRLRNLYIADNSFRSFDNIPSPIIAPLQKLDLSRNNLERIPKEIGILPDLYHLNISSNPLRDLTPQQFSPFCHLKEVNISDSRLKTMRCDCEKVTRFLERKRDIYIFSFYCDGNSAECRFENSTFTETDDYEKCMSIRRQVLEHETAQVTWSIIGLSVLGFLIIFIGCLYCIHRRNVNQMRKKAKINNPAVKPKMTAANNNDPASDESTTGSPEKLLIKRSDV
ncbi:peroxidasin homolog pxn-1-like [Chironomus tepperi]|uniref:peroxidasin homolog pxn-1-like n=1 Tax=Chironomus tepperi TaxID=113505 RepID=UPI00391F8C0C